MIRLDNPSGCLSLRYRKRKTRKIRNFAGWVLSMLATVYLILSGAR